VPETPDSKRRTRNAEAKKAKQMIAVNNYTVVEDRLIISGWEAQKHADVSVSVTPSWIKGMDHFRMILRRWQARDVLESDASNDQV
jgi:hypothetical protein